MARKRKVYVLYLAGYTMAARRLVTPLGLLIVATSIKASGRFGSDDRVFICDTLGEVRRRVRAHKRDDVCFLVSSVQVLRGVTPETNTAIQACRSIRSLCPKVFCIVGGPDVALNPRAYDSEFDLVFEGEVGTTDLVAVIESGVRRYSAGFADLSAEQVDYSLLGKKKYLCASLQMARGCPYRCSFCNVVSIYGEKTRVMSDGGMYERLQSLARYHQGFVIISDDNFGGIPRRAEELLDVMIRFQEANGYPFKFVAQATMNMSKKPALMEKFRRAGLVAAFIGVESPSKDVLKSVRKRHNTTRPLAEQVRVFIDHGIVPLLSFILGLDEEEDDVTDQTKALLEACGTPLIGLNLFNPVVGSQLYRDFEAAGRLLNHPTYSEHWLIPAKTLRDYEAIVDDYADITHWFFDSRRLLGYVARVNAAINENRSPALESTGDQKISWWLLLRTTLIYLLLCLRSGTWQGVPFLFRLDRSSRTRFLYSLAVTTVALGLKTDYLKATKRLRAGLAQLRHHRLYPFEARPDQPGPPQELAAAGRPGA